MFLTNFLQFFPLILCIFAQNSDNTIPGAAYNNNFDGVKKMVEQEKRNVNEEDLFGYTGLHNAAIKGNKKIVNFLLQNGANAAAKTKPDYTGRTPLHMAAWEGHTEIVKILLAASGTNVNEKDSDGGTALHNIAESIKEGRGPNDTEPADFPGSLRALLAAGANPGLKNKAGKTAAELAQERGMTTMVDILKKKN